MSKVFIFDVDGTLTPSRQRMTEEFAKFFDEWASKNKYYLVTGSDIDKTKEQVPIAYIDRANGIFTCCGNQFYIEDELVYENKFEPPKDLIEYLENQLEISQFFSRCGNHIENRGSMLNFSVVGRDCSLDKRKIYFNYDNKEGERKKIAEEIRKKWHELDAVIGGQISIDIYPKGKDKSQILEHIKNRNIVTSKDEYIFIGDRTQEGGNDYPLAKLIEETSNCSYYQTEGPEETQKILEELNG